MVRALYLLFVLATLGLGGWGAYLAFQPAEGPGSGPEPAGLGVVIENPEHDLGTVAVDTHRVTFRVRNHSQGVGELVGFPQGCRDTCCFQFLDTDRRPVPAGETLEAVGLIKVLAPGPFEYADDVYLNDRGVLRIVRIKLIGSGVKEGDFDGKNP